MNFLQNLMPKSQPAQTEQPSKAKILIVRLSMQGMEVGKDKIPPLVQPMLMNYLDALSNEDAASICEFIVKLGKTLESELKNEIVGNLTGLDE